MRIRILKRKWYEFWKKPEAKCILDEGDRLTIEKLWVNDGVTLECRKDSVVKFRSCGDIKLIRGEGE